MTGRESTTSAQEFFATVDPLVGEGFGLCPAITSPIHTAIKKRLRQFSGAFRVLVPDT